MTVEIPRISPAPHWWVLVLGGLGFLTVLTFNDAAYADFPLLPRAALFGIFWVAVALHVFEAGVAFMKSRSLGWTLQTLVLGFPSLGLLLKAHRIAGTTPVVWITGASSGIGEALALTYAKRGARLVISARRREELERVAKACAPAPVLVLPLDMTEQDSFADKAAQVVAHYGRLDIMVHNAGISSRSLIKDTEMHVHRRLMEVNYFGVVALTRAVLAQKPKFVVVSSVVGHVATPMRSSYAASKHALHGFCDALRAEGFFVTIVCPGYVQTAITKHALTGGGAELGKVENNIAQGATPQKTAAQIAAAAESNLSEVYVGDFGKEWVALQLKRFFPSVLEGIVKKSVPQ